MSHPVFNTTNLSSCLQVAEVFQTFAVQISNLATLRKEIVNGINQNPAMRSYLPTAKILTKHTLAFGKFFRRLQQLNHQKFALLPLCSDLVSFYWTQVVEASTQPPGSISGNVVLSIHDNLRLTPHYSDSDEVLYPLRFLVQGMVLFKENLAQWTVVKKNGAINENTRAFSGQFIQKHTLTTRSFDPAFRGGCCQAARDTLHASQLL